jgi:hypothetical protein
MTHLQTQTRISIHNHDYNPRQQQNLDFNNEEEGSVGGWKRRPLGKEIPERCHAVLIRWQLCC